MKTDGLWAIEFEAESLDDFALSNDVRKTLDRALKNNLRRPLLFVGSYGVGKTSVARFFSNRLYGKVDLVECGKWAIMTATEQKALIQTYEKRLNGKGGLGRFFLDKGQREVIIFDEFHNVGLKQQRSLSNVLEADGAAAAIFTSNSVDDVDMLVNERCGGEIAFDVVDAHATAAGNKLVVKQGSAEDWHNELVRVGGRYAKRFGYHINDDIAEGVLKEKLRHYTSVRRFIQRLQEAYEDDGILTDSANGQG